MNQQRQTLGLYISIPFCRSKCTFCNFASGVYPARDHARYIDRLIADITASQSFADENNLSIPRDLQSVYLGGGTPTLLRADLFTRLFAAIRNHFTISPQTEITVECAPGTLEDATLAAMTQLGVNRVSLGVQSFVDSEARNAGRLHNRVIVERDITRLRSAGITNINIDLIAGLAGQTAQTWQESLDALTAQSPAHASIYMFEKDEDSRLGREALEGGARYSAAKLPTDDEAADMYASAIEHLARNGLTQYEISNFAQPGKESAHNLRYWQRGPYLGLGLDASSALYFTTADERNPLLARFTTTDNLLEYLAAPPAPRIERLNAQHQLEEAWFLGLRTNRGINLASLSAEFGEQAAASSSAPVASLIADGLLNRNGDTIQLTPRGREISNEVFAQFIQSPVGTMQ